MEERIAPELVEECTDLGPADEVGTVHSEALRGADHAEEPRSRGL